MMMTGDICVSRAMMSDDYNRAAQARVFAHLGLLT